MILFYKYLLQCTTLYSSCSGKGVMAGNPDVSNEWKSVSDMSDTGSSLLWPGFSVPPVDRGPPHGLGFHT